MKPLRISLVISLLVALGSAQAGSAQAASEPRKGTFYLNMSIGCYSEKQGPGSVPADNPNYKTQYRKSCSAPHHYQVFGVFKVPGYTATRNLTQTKAQEVCVAAYQRYLGYSINDGDSESPSVQWFFPDDGAEARKFPGKLICAFIKTDGAMKTIYSWTGQY